jgi:hypothetical protein
VFVPNYAPGGGGIYIKADEKNVNVGYLIATAKGGLDGKQPSDVKGTTMIVRDLPSEAAKEDEVKVMWIMWHEMGHAVGDRKSPKNTSEDYAYKFEYHSLTVVYNTGKLAEWKITKEDLKTFYAKRKSDTKDSAERQAFESLVT